MGDLVDLISASVAMHSRLESALFGSAEPAVVAAVIDDICGASLGAGVADGLFYRAGVGLVAGIRLHDGREVVVKVHRWHAPIDRLQATQAVQSALSTAGLPAPRPIAIVPLAAGVATVEELRPGGPGDARRPATRRAMASTLLSLVRTAPAADVGPALLLRPRGAPLWPEPHDLRFDLTLPGGEWIDEMAASARARLATPLPHVVGHLDWRVENLGFDGDDIVAIWDWDSLGTAPEAAIVGSNAAQFTTDWSRPDPLPTVDEMRLFVADYEAARGTAFSRDEWEVLDAANLFLCAYSARCQHSDRSTGAVGGDVAPVWADLLRTRGRRLERG